MGVIYTIMNPKGKLYVGKTYDLKKRINCHKSASKKGSNIILHNSIRKYGWENHFLKVIETVPDELLNEREIFWIVTLKTYCYENKMGMNMTIGGEGQRSTWMHDTDRRKMMSDRFSGKNNPMYGKPHPRELQDRINAQTSIRNKKNGITVPKWGADKGIEITRKSVVAYDSNGCFISEYISLIEAAKQLNLNRKNISSVLAGKQTNTRGFFFTYKTENYPHKIDVPVFKSMTVKKAVLLLNKMKQIIKEYEDAAAASLDLGIPRGNISRAAHEYNYKPLRIGHIFKYKDEHFLNN